MNKPHKHAEIIKAWADGHDIQTRWRSTKTGEWTEWRDEEWNDVEFFYDYEYRIKPEPKPDVVQYGRADFRGEMEFCLWGNKMSHHDLKDNLKLTFDGETGELKSAEVLK